MSFPKIAIIMNDNLSKATRYDTFILVAFFYKIYFSSENLKFESGYKFHYCIKRKGKVYVICKCI